MTGQDWQSAVDSNLVNRLMRPLVQPGAIDGQLGASILARTEQMTNHLPLLVQFAQRQVGVFQPEQIPIVYAQPSSSVQVVHSHTETTTAPLTIVRATLISNSTSNHYTSNSTKLSSGESESGSVNAIVSPRLSSSSQNLAIVYAQNISNESKSDRPNQTPTVRPLAQILHHSQPEGFQAFRSSHPPAPNSIPGRGSAMNEPPNIGLIATGARFELPLIAARSEAPTLPIITVHTGTEAAPPTATWQTRTQLNETATTLPIVFAQPNPAASRTSPDLAQFSESPSSFPSVTETFSAPPSPPSIDLDTLTTQVERKILRRLVVESERRGKPQWR